MKQYLTVLIANLYFKLYTFLYFFIFIAKSVLRSSCNVQ